MNPVIAALVAFTCLFIVYQIGKFMGTQEVLRRLERDLSQMFDNDAKKPKKRK